jgi:hypothetical protein
LGLSLTALAGQYEPSILMRTRGFSLIVPSNRKKSE